MWWEAEDDGGTSGTRTRDHRIKSAMLLPTELSSHQRSATVAGAWLPSAQRSLAAGPNANDNSLMYSIYGNLQSSREEFLWRIGVAVPGVAGDIWCEVAILWGGPGERAMGRERSEPPSRCRAPVRTESQEKASNILSLWSDIHAEAPLCCVRCVRPRDSDVDQADVPRVQEPGGAGGSAGHRPAALRGLPP